MKRLFLSAILFAALFASCKPEEPEATQTNKAPEGALVGTFKAPVVEGFESTPGSEQRFAKFGNQFSFVWETGDKIAVLTTQGTKTYVLNTGAGTPDGTFVGSLQTGEQISNRLSYPNANTTALSSESVTMTLPTSYQYGDAATFTEIPTLMPSAAVINNNSFVMEHLVGYFAFEISNIPAGSDKFVFEVTNDKKINGSFTADIENGINAFATTDASNDAERIVTINFTPSTEVSTRCFIVPVPTGTYQFTWTIFAGTTINGFYEKATDVTVGQGNIKGARLACSSIGGGEVDPYNGHAYVDLGLSVKWATMNVGANNPQEYGGHYQWAGTVDVSNTSINLTQLSAPYHASEYQSYNWTKYVRSEKAFAWEGAGDPDNKTVLESMDDAASVNWGGNWRMPTQSEWTELRNESNCTWTWKRLEGVYGFEVKSKKAGFTNNWIFLPAAGYRDGNNLILKTNGDLYGPYIRYWSATLSVSQPGCAFSVEGYYHPTVYQNMVNWADPDRYWGLSVRPVIAAE